MSFAVWYNAFCGRLFIASESNKVSRYEKKGVKEMTLKKRVEDSAYDMLLELVDKYNEADVLNELFLGFLDTDTKVEFIISFIRYWETPKNIFDTEDLQAVEEYAKIHC